MNVLIIEDDINKLTAVTNYIKDSYHIFCDYKMSYHSGLAALLKLHYDLLLLDMSMPTYDVAVQETGGRPLAMAGRDILFQLRRRKIHLKTIVVTQYEDFDGISLKQLDQELQKDFGQLYMGYVYYNVTQDDWKSRLDDIILPIIRGDDLYDTHTCC